MAQPQREPIIGAGHAQAMFRAGLKELAQILPAFPGQGVQPVEEQGLLGNPTNIEVLRGKEQDAEEEYGKAASQFLEKRMEAGIDQAMEHPSEQDLGNLPDPLVAARARGQQQQEQSRGRER